MSTKQTAKTGPAKPRRTTANTPKPKVMPDWVETAWRAHLRTPNYSEIARQLSAPDRETGQPRYGKPINRESVALWVPRYAAVVRAALEASDDDALVEYVAEVQEVKQQAWVDHQRADSGNARAGSLRLVLDALEKIAAARGVVTQRKAEEVTGDVNWHGDSPCETLRNRIAELAARAGAAEPAGEPDGG